MEPERCWSPAPWRLRNVADVGGTDVLFFFLNSNFWMKCGSSWFFLDVWIKSKFGTQMLDLEKCVGFLLGDGLTL